MKTYKVALFGHRDLYAHKKVEERLYPLLRDLILNKQYVEFYIGRNGEFDTFAASLLKRAQKLGKEIINLAKDDEYEDE